MALARTVVSLGRAAREEVQIRVRQPLRVIHAVLPASASLRESVVDTIREELNVKGVRFLTSGDEVVTLSARPNFRALGPRFQKQSQEVGTAIRNLPSAALAGFQDTGTIEIQLDGATISLGPEEVEVVQEARGDLVIRSMEGVTVALDPTMDEELRREGLARELVSRIQRLRKDSGLEITDRIRLRVTGGAGVAQALEEHGAGIQEETLALSLEFHAGVGPDADVLDLNGEAVWLELEKATP